MADEKIKQKEAELINLVSNFCDDKLNDEYKELSINMVQKLGRKHDVPFKRGKLENWASGIIYALAQINFLFDKSFEPYLSADDICDYFKTKKSTASNKARDIRKLFNLDYFDAEFSTHHMIESQPKLYVDNKSGLIVDHDTMVNSFDNWELEKMIDKINSVKGEVPVELTWEFFEILMNSTLLTSLSRENLAILESDGQLFLALFTNSEELRKIFPNVSEAKIVPFYELCKFTSNFPGEHQIKSVVINPDSQQFEIPFDLIKKLYDSFK